MLISSSGTLESSVFIYQIPHAECCLQRSTKQIEFAIAVEIEYEGKASRAYTTSRAIASAWLKHYDLVWFTEK